MMIGDPTSKTMFGCKTQVGVGTGQTRNGVKSHAVHSGYNGQGEQRLVEELDGMGGVEHSRTN
jgi:hypothetical protein